jgi:molecular chaperone GrpE (heat shock protein)
LENLKEKNESLLDKYKRALAEVENSRKRGQRQVEEAKTFAIQGFCKDLLEVSFYMEYEILRKIPYIIYHYPTLPSHSQSY